MAGYDPSRMLRHTFELRRGSLISTGEWLLLITIARQPVVPATQAGLSADLQDVFGQGRTAVADRIW